MPSFEEDLLTVTVFILRIFTKFLIFYQVSLCCKSEAPFRNTFQPLGMLPRLKCFGKSAGDCLNFYRVRFFIFSGVTAKVFIFCQEAARSTTFGTPLSIPLKIIYPES
jgi:hypothetical protein